MSDHVEHLPKRVAFRGSMLIFLALLLSWCALLIVFNVFPGIDLVVSRRAFTAQACAPSDPINLVCGEFAYDSVSIFIWFRTLSLYLPYLAVFVLLFLLFQAWKRHGAQWRGPATDLYLAALASLTLGPGLVVNLFLKTYSGRPRPRDTDLFGGSLDFVQAGSFAGKCLRNCSFVSGESSSGGWLLCLVLLLPPRLRVPLGLPLAAVSLLMPALRVLTGAHYLSDAVLGWLSSLVIFAGLIALLDVLGSKAPEELSITLANEAQRAQHWARSARRMLAVLLDRGRGRFVEGAERLVAAPVLARPRGAPLLERPAAILAIFLALSVFAMLRIDYPMGVWMQSFPRELRGMVKWLSGLGTGQSILTVTGLILLLRIFAPLDRWPVRATAWMNAATTGAAYIFLSVAGGGLIAALAKNIIGRARPDILLADGAYSFRPFAFDADFAAFPSGHSATAGAMAISLALTFPALRPLIMPLGVLICLSRQMIGAHWASDTLMGWAVGAAFALWLAHIFARRKLLFSYNPEGRLIPIADTSERR